MVDPIPSESRDGTGAADNDEPYAFHENMLLKFNTRQQARLLILRGRVREVLDIVAPTTVASHGFNSSDFERAPKVQVDQQAVKT